MKTGSASVIVKRPKLRTCSRLKNTTAAVRAHRSLCGDNSGMAATEFALLLPVIVLIFFGVLEISDAMMANRRVVNATNSLADLVTQEKKISTDQVADIFSGVASMIEPSSPTDITMRIVSITVDPGADPDSTSDDKIVVEWSRDKTGATPYVVGSEYDKIDDLSIIKANTSLVVAEMTYQYESGLSNRILGAPITFSRVASRWPRRSTHVQLCNADFSTCS